MKTPLLRTMALTAGTLAVAAPSHSDTAHNPIIHSDVPDISVIRVGKNYYMSSTTMHLSPGVPIMKSTDLVNWKMVSYAYDVLDDVDALNLKNGKSSYGSGSWASSLRYHNGLYYVSTFAGTTGKTYIYSTKNIEKGPWKAVSFKPMLHDHSLFFDDDGRVYMIYGGGKLNIVELKADLSGLKPDGVNQVAIENASAPSGPNVGLPAEGSQLFKVNGKYYLFNITWPKNGMRTVVIHRADKITGPYEGRVALQDKGVAQGGLIDTPQGKWYAYLFRDFGAVGRIPYLVPVKWEDDWPVLGIEGKVPDKLELPANKSLKPGIVASDEFKRKPGDNSLPLVWQWNHNPDNALWSLTQRPGFLRLTTGRTDTDFLSARNTLTQRTYGPQCSGITSIDVSNMKDGDCAGLSLLQKKYGLVGVKMSGGTKSIFMTSAESDLPVEIQSVPLAQSKVYLRADCDFGEKVDKAYFYYSLDGKKWEPIGSSLKMVYTLPHFMGYRFGLFNYAIKNTGGFVDFDYFRIDDKILTPAPKEVATVENRTDNGRPLPRQRIVLAPDDKPAFPSAPVGFDQLRSDIPHGEIKKVEYPSSTVGNQRNMLIYTPPGYSKDKKYPVLYLLHGIGGDEWEWKNNGAPEIILDNLYAAKKLQPMIVVLPNGRAQADDRPIGNVFASAPAFETFEGDLLKDIIPFIETNYSVKSGAKYRALAGLSMGGGQSLNFGLGNLDTFAWIGGFSSAPNTRQPEKLLPEPATARKKLKLLWLSCGDKDDLLFISQRTHRYLNEHKVLHIWHVEPGGHDFAVWKQDLYNFAQLLFR